jgi:hypothetical protein
VLDVDRGYDSYYATYYAERLWQMLPAVYRSADTDSLDLPGPLRELINRIGAQVAVVRRSIDRLWEDQSIETCDDWVIPYIGDLLGTNLVPNLDAPAQRLDVANTVAYRRRKGTVGVLEELAVDITGWPAHVVEGFRRLARTRHGLDPAVGQAAFPQSKPADVAALLQAENLTGSLTGGLVGGLTDLRSRHGAALADTAFDEAFHTADFRVGRGAVGRFGIPKLLVFLWRLKSFPVTNSSPVPVAGCADQYVFDPTGREVPLFLPPPPKLEDFAGSWTPAREWQMPGPLTTSLEKAITDSGTVPPPRRPTYPDAADVTPRYALKPDTPQPQWQLETIWPELGRFTAKPVGSPIQPLTVDYNYGFASWIGAGPYDRTQLPDPPATSGTKKSVTGGSGLDGALKAIGATGTVTIGDKTVSRPDGDSLTYSSLADVGSTTAISQVLLRAYPQTRPVLRPSGGAAPWTFTGSGDEAQLVLDGLTVSGCDIVLRGSFKTVRFTACTIDPGTAADGSPPIATAVDGAPLAPNRIFVEGAIQRLLVDHCILGPIRTRLGGSVESLEITDSIVQGLPTTVGPAVGTGDIFDPLLLVRGLLAGGAVSTMLRAKMPAAAVAALHTFTAESLSNQHSGVSSDVLDGLNALVHGPELYKEGLFEAVRLSAETYALVREAPVSGSMQLAALNRALIDESFPVALGAAALAVADAKVQLQRVTVLGRIAAHQLFVSDSILRDFAAVEDLQQGCVRFSAYAGGSALPRRYESAEIVAGAPIFTSDSYGNPGYGQLLETADTAIVNTAAAASISAGAENNSEMGAFSADLNPVKEQGLLIKYAEYMPLGLTPVIVHVT